MKKFMLWMLAPLALVLMVSCGDQQKINDLNAKIESLEAQLEKFNLTPGQFVVHCDTPATDTVYKYAVDEFHFALSPQSGDGYFHVIDLDSTQSKAGFVTTKRIKLDNVNLKTNATGDTLLVWLCQNVANPLPQNRATAIYRERTLITKIQYNAGLNRYIVSYRDTSVSPPVGKWDTVHPLNIIMIRNLETDAKPVIGIADYLNDDPTIFN